MDVEILLERHFVCTKRIVKNNENNWKNVDKSN